MERSAVDMAAVVRFTRGSRRRSEVVAVERDVEVHGRPSLESAILSAAVASGPAELDADRSDAPPVISYTIRMPGRASAG